MQWGLSYEDKAQFYALAKRLGRRHEYRQFLKTFGTADSAEEILERVRVKLAAEPAFREKWAGWRFMAVEYTACLDVMPYGIGLEEHRVNETQSVVLA